ncbi:MAG: PhoX family phosphatase [Planctomycetes bacterium]|nr:PhoX family phosphatase [Planctomycetota bacterium]
MEETREESPAFQDVWRARIARRDALRGLGALAAGLAVGRAAHAEAALGTDAPDPTNLARGPVTRESRSTLRFAEVPQGVDDRMHVPPGHTASVVIAWGDPVVAGAPPFDPAQVTRERQELQFGTENDFLAFLPLPRGSGSSTHGLLCANHEGAQLRMMFPGLEDRSTALARSTRAQVEAEMAALGHSVVEVELVDGRWRVVAASRYGRRITAASTWMRATGPAAGHARLCTSEDSTGARILGTFNCCAGGVTPWGTVLVCEENVNKHFSGKSFPASERRNHARMGVGSEVEYGWSRFHARFDAEREPHEPNRHGWVVEYDPYDPLSVPVKRTALGRFKHEGAATTLAPDGRVVVYMGDDDEHEFVYRFVSARPFDPTDPAANRDLLDTGELCVARFEPDGTLRWLPLVHGVGPLTQEHGFASQADVLIEARSAATLLGATRMDRPEDVESNPATGRVYVLLTNNTKRVPGEQDAANPRAPNRHGHVLELVPPTARDGLRDHAAAAYRWEVFLFAGDPFELPSTTEITQRAAYHPEVSRDGWFTCPDNAAFDAQGRLWIATDGGSRLGIADGIWATDTLGPGRALTRRFFRAPVGAEVCGPCFTPDCTTLFVAVQHPGESDARGSSKGVHHARPTARFPDYDEALPARSAVVAIRREDGGALG